MSAAKPYVAFSNDYRAYLDENGQLGNDRHVLKPYCVLEQKLDDFDGRSLNDFKHINT